MISRTASLLCCLLGLATAQVEKNIEEHRLMRTEKEGELSSASYVEAPCKACSSMMVSGMEAGFNGCYDLQKGKQTFQRQGSANAIWCESTGGSARNDGRWRLGTDSSKDPKYEYQFIGCCNPPKGRWNHFAGLKGIAFQNLGMECSASPCAAEKAQEATKVKADDKTKDKQDEKTKADDKDQGEEQADEKTKADDKDQGEGQADEKTKVDDKDQGEGQADEKTKADDKDQGEGQADENDDKDQGEGQADEKTKADDKTEAKAPLLGAKAPLLR